MRRHALPLILILALGTLFLIGRELRGQLGFELSAESIQQWVLSLGWKAPVAFVLLLLLRQFLLVPSILILAAGGVCFGALAGTALGALGIALSAGLQFAAARVIGREWLRPRFGEAMRELERRVEVAGPWLVGLATAHPTGPMSPMHWAAGFSTLSVIPFGVAVVLAAPVRAFAYSFFGSALLSPGSLRFWVATGTLVLVALLPLVHPGVRRRLFPDRPGA